MTAAGTRVEVRVELKPGMVDAEAMATKRALDLLGIEGLESVSLSRTYELDFDGLPGQEALKRAQECVEKLLANPVIHAVSVRLRAPEGAAGSPRSKVSPSRRPRG